MYIERLNSIDNIIELQNDFYKKHHIQPFNVSNWTVSSEFRLKMEQTFKLTNDVSPIDYLYSYNISDKIRDKVLIKLGLDSKFLSEKACTFFPNNSLSIVNVCNLLQKKKIQKVGILNPAYFSIPACLNTYGISFETIHLNRKKDEFSIPIKELLTREYDAVWITSPIYSTGCCYNKKELEKIKLLLENNTFVITDESFCVSGKELLREFGHYNNFIGIYSPHKALSINSYKFSVVVSDIKYEEFFEQWLDIFCGNLPQTTIAAIHHYISNNYHDCKRTFESFMEDALNNVLKITKDYDNIHIDKNTYGNMVTIHVKNLNYEETQQLYFIKKVIENTHTLYYPGSLNGFPKEWGFCFRINLALYGSEFTVALHRLLQYFSELE